jgi:3-deoxy-D-manno-octulosonic-acid transferase
LRYLYIFLSYLLMPLILIRLFWKSIKTPSYIERLQERFGFFENPVDKCIWIHAVSVGETIAATPLIRACLKIYPDLPIVLTSTTPTGYAQAKMLFSAKEVKCGYMPYDLPGSIHRFLNRINPHIAIFMETELWPNILHTCRKRNIPSLLANARLSERSAKAYRGLGPLAREMFASLTHIAAQAEPDALRFIQLGAATKHVSICGNLKFDMPVPNHIYEQSKLLREALGENRPIWIAGSTHEGEEELMLKCYAKLRYQLPKLLLILVPRHPERFRSVESLCKKFNFSIVSRSSGEPILDTTQIYLGDTMGELMLLYSAADLAFVGGSFVKVGGHNLLEPAALGKAVLSGPFLFNFLTISKELSNNKALLIAKDYNQLATQITQLFGDPKLREEMGKRGFEVVQKNRGSLEKHLSLLHALIQNKISLEKAA